MLLPCVVSARAAQDTGTLIVSYDTGECAERLDRIRFLLISEDNNESMYPKNDSYVEGHDCHSRIVAINDLPVGTYRIRFVIPNVDHLFDPIPEVSVQIVKNKVTRLDQIISTHTSDKNNDKAIIADSYIMRRPSGGIIINQIYAQVTVTSNMPEAHWTLMRGNTPIYTGIGSIENYQVPDGDDYRIVPEPIEGYIKSQPTLIV